MTTIHPKTAGAAIGSALGVLLLAVANAIHGVHLPQGVTDAIAAFLPIVGAYLAPAPDTPVAAPQAPVPVAVAPAVPVAPPPLSAATLAELREIRTTLDVLDPPPPR